MAKLEHRKIDLHALARQLDQAKHVDAKGGVSFSGFEMEEVLTVLSSCVQWSLTIPDREKESILNAAAFAAGSGTITKDALEKQISRLEHEYRQRPEIPYVLVTTLSLGTWPWNLPRSVKLDGRTITFSQKLPKQFDRSALAKKFARDFEQRTTDKFAVVRIHVKARSISEAAENAFDTLDFLRGLWNLSLNRTLLSRLFSGRPKPINRIRLGPIHTLHHPNGTLAAQTYWYDPFFSETDIERVNDDEWRRVKHDSAEIRKRMAGLSYGLTLRDVILRYTRALDSADFEKAFLKLWTVLEVLTDTSVSQGYDQTIRRALFIWRDSELNAAILEHLRTFRNATVHSGFSSHHIESHTFQLKRYVEELLLFHIFAKPRFRSLHAAGEFFDIPRDPAALRARIDLLERALQFRTRPRRRRSEA
jgi:hypothetical protein